MSDGNNDENDFLLKVEGEDSSVTCKEGKFEPFLCFLPHFDSLWFNLFYHQIACHSLAGVVFVLS